MVTAIIPARYKSKRFPGKMLALIHGKPMIEWVYKAVNNCKVIQRTFIATDDEKIKTVCEEKDMKCIMTSEKHDSGSDRIYEAATILGCNSTELIINVQGDEPCIEDSVIRKVVEPLFKYPNISVTSAATEIAGSMATNPNSVKVVTNNAGMALYFSRSIIPYRVDPLIMPILKHIGIYGFHMWSLKEFITLPRLSLEKAERLEQLRLIENQRDIFIAKVDYQGIGVDEPGDIQRAEEYIAMRTLKNINKGFNISFDKLKEGESK